MSCPSHILWFGHSNYSWWSSSYNLLLPSATSFFLSYFSIPPNAFGVITQFLLFQSVWLSVLNFLHLKPIYFSLDFYLTYRKFIFSFTTDRNFGAVGTMFLVTLSWTVFLIPWLSKLLTYTLAFSGSFSPYSWCSFVLWLLWFSYSKFHSFHNTLLLFWLTDIPWVRITNIK